MSAKAVRAWLAVAALLLGTGPAYGDTSAEIAARLDHAKAALTATRGQLTPEQWALLSGKLAGAEKALADYNQFVANTGRTMVTAKASTAASSEVLAAEGEATAARSTVSVLGRVGVIFLSLVTIQSDEDPTLYESRQKRVLEEQLREIGRAAEQVKSEIEQASKSPAPKPARLDEEEEDEDGDIHHIATNKNDTSDARGGPWTPRFREIFEKAGMTMNDPANTVRVKGHRGPHPEQYHRQVRDVLKLATDDCVGVVQCRERLTRALWRLGVECSTPGTRLNQLITTPAAG
ncbi:MAG TPA: AHH domain-containing protein [Archangium sp.]|uniref:AHH domain-containing protein n=1 Tax=Archangium sp. TaxID=1872627 RepID=UPI002E3112EC|nr:AHH domain-containing protein [Archangium sp.]HEX5745767.1 AHH domain-containing protein [Archangium sp.]